MGRDDDEDEDEDDEDEDDDAVWILVLCEDFYMYNIMDYIFLVCCFRFFWYCLVY